jgi:hypothetical protein
MICITYKTQKPRNKLENCWKNSGRGFHDDFQLFFMDETALSLDPILRACWMKMGEQKRVPLPTNQEKKRCHLFGAYNWFNDHIDWMITQWKNSDTFITFLERLEVEKHPTDRNILVLDRASCHKSAATLAALSLFEHGS